MFKSVWDDCEKELQVYICYRQKSKKLTYNSHGFFRKYFNKYDLLTKIKFGMNPKSTFIAINNIIIVNGALVNFDKFNIVIIYGGGKVGGTK